MGRTTFDFTFDCGHTGLFIRRLSETKERAVARYRKHTPNILCDKCQEKEKEKEEEGERARSGCGILRRLEEASS